MLTQYELQIGLGYIIHSSNKNNYILIQLIDTKESSQQKKISNRMRFVKKEYNCFG